MDKIAESYVRLIQAGRRTIDDVPVLVRDLVIEKLKEAGYEI